MPKYLSGRVKRTPQNKLTDDRYQYLDIGQAEPNIGDPPTASGTPGIPVGQQYQLVSVLSNPGERYWIPIGGGLIPGAISIYEEGSLVSGVSSITQLNFVGNSLTADAAPYVAGVSAGNIATITAAPPGPNSSVLFKESNDFATSTDLVFNSGILTIGKGVKIGIGGTIITANASTGYPLVGINEANPTQELDVNGDIRIRGTIYDFNNEPGDQGELLLKGLNGLEWTNQNAITAGAGGDIGQVQYHNTAGLVDGADIFYYDAVNDRVGIGSTQPAQVFDVLGVSTFIGGVTVDHLYVTGITTALNLINADGGIKANTAQVTDLTEDRVVYVGPNGELVDSSNLTFDDYTFGASGINVSGCTTTSQLEATGVSTLGNIQLNTNTIDTKLGNLNLNSAGGTVQVNAKIFLNNVTQSTTKSTGALTITGGLGIIKDVNVGGAVSFKGEPTGVAVTLAAAGGITTTGGDLYVGGDLFIKDDTVFSDGKFEQLLVNPGIATFRGDVEFWSNADSDKIAYWDKSADSLRFNDDARIKLGNSDDLQLYHSSNINYIINGISDGELRIVNGVGPANIAKFINACSVDLYYDSANFPLPKLQTSGIGVTVTGQLDAATADLSSTLTVGGASNLNGDVNLGNALTDDIVFGGKVDSHILPNTSETYDLGSGANRWDTVYARTFDGLGTLTVEDLYVTGIATFKDDVEFHGTGGVDSKGNVGIKSAFWDKSEMRFRYLDNIEASWGDTRELQIYHFDDSYIKNTSATGNLYVDSTNEFYIRTEGGVENAITAKTNEGVDLYYDGGLRLSTYDKGIKLSANGTVGAAVSIYDGNNSNYAAIKSPNTLTADYTLTLPPNDGGPDNVLKTDGDGILSWIAQGDLTAKPGGENTEFQFNNNGSFDGSVSFVFDESGSLSYGGANSVHFLSLTTAADPSRSVIWQPGAGQLILTRETEIKLGTANMSGPSSIYYTDSGATSYWKATGSGSIELSGDNSTGTHTIKINPNSAKSSIIATANAEVSLSHDGTKRIETTSDGIKITGGIRDKDDQLGTAGQILSSTGSQLDWIDQTTGPVGQADQVKTTKSTTNATYYLTFVDSNNDPGAYESVYTAAGINFNPNTEDLSVDGRLYLNGVDNNFQGSIWSKGGADKKFVIGNDSTEAETYLVVANSSNTQIGIATFKCSTADGDKSYFRSDVSVPVNESYNLGDSITQRWNNVYAKTYHGEVLKLYDSDKTHKITLQTPATADLTADYTLTLPQNDGATNEVLTTDGNGILSWTAKGSGGTGGLTNILVDYTGRSAPCDMPITISTPSSGTKQINIPDSSNAFGAKYVQTSEPTGTSVCDGDIWYDTTPGPTGYGGSFTKVAVVRDQKNKGVNGGTFAQDAWRDRDLTVEDDPFSFVTLYPTTNGQTTPSPGNTPGYFSLPAGKYKITFSAAARNVNSHLAAIIWDSDVNLIDKVYNYSTDASQLDGYFYGSSAYSPSDVTTFSKGSAIVDIAATAYFKVIHYCKNGDINTGFGIAADIGTPDKETYLIIEIEDLKTAIKEPTGSDIPVGGIIMYSGTDTELNALTNWKLCDGTTYGSVTTPNLKDKFVIGADQYSSGWKTNVTGSLTQSGGSKDAVVVSHTHTQTGGSSLDDGGAHVPGSAVSVTNMTNISTTGVSGTNQNLPPYYALAYIMRIS